MIALERHIEILLLNHDCVIVPNFGGFMAHHVSAHYVDEAQIFYPPIRTIGFNPQLIINDSLLAQSYIDVYDISYPEALTKIEREVAELKQHLQNEGQYNFTDLGVLYLNGEGIYHFEPCEAGILTPSLYGFGSIDIAPLKKGISEQNIVKEINRQVVINESNQEKTLQLDTETIPESLKEAPNSLISLEDSQPKTVEIRLSWLRNIAAACLVIAAFILFPTPLENTSLNAELFGKLNTNVLEQVLPKPQAHNPVQIEVQDSIQSQRVDSFTHSGLAKSEQAEQIVKEDFKPFYTIVLASRITKTNAIAFIKELSNKGIIDAKVYSTPKNNKVIYGTFGSQQEAYNVLNKLITQPKFEDAWVTLVNHPESQ